MAFDLKGATFAAGALLGNTGVRQSSLPFITSKALWKTHIEGAYNLIYPLMHINYPTRDEVDLAIVNAFKAHDMSNFHNGEGSTPGRTQVPKVLFIPKEIISNAGLPIRPNGTIVDYGV